MKKKIIFIANDFWLDSDEKWGINLFKENGYEVELWRIGAITLNFSVFEELKFTCTLRNIKTWKEYYRLIIRQKIKQTIFLFFGSYSSLHISMAIIRILGGKYCIVDFGSANNTRNAILTEKRIYGTEKHWMDFFMPNYSFLGSRHNISSMNSRYQINHGNNIYLHTYDYDVFLKNKHYGSNIIDIKQPYILFIDQNFFDHKDQINASMKKWIPNEDIFIEEMRRFLEEVERQFEMPIVVAAHPVTSKKIKEIYGNRQIVYGNTCAYTANAEMVISSSSGAMGYAVIYQKPILLYNNYQLRRNFFYMELQMPKARLLNAPIVDISTDLSDVKLKEYVTKTDNNKYMEYLTDDINNNELFMNTVLRYLNTL
jgi:hypothetical protein